jgi:hypothetical protein
MESVPEQFRTQDAFEPQPIPRELETPPQRSLARRIFIGPFGLRAGWSLLIYFAILATIIFSARAIHHYNKVRAHQSAIAAAKAAGKPAPADSAKPDPNAPMLVGEAIEEEGISFAIILVVSLIMALIERRRFTAYGLGGQRSVGRFLVGAFWGVAAVSLLVGALRVLHLVSFDAQLDHGWQILRWGGLQLIGLLFVGLLEEYMFRGYLQFTLTRGLVGLANLISRPHSRSIAFWMANGRHFRSFLPRPHRKRRRGQGGSAAGVSCRRHLCCCSLAHWIAVVGNRLPHGVGLVAILPLRCPLTAD